MNIAVIFAGGIGTRMGNKSIPKQFLNIHGKPIIIYTLEKFDNSADIDHIVVVCIKSFIEKLYKLIKKFNIKKIVKVVPGGKTGQESIFNGLKSIASEFDGGSIVLIHDGVRPFINSEIIKKSIDNVKKYGACACAVKSKETISLVEDGKVKKILDRSKCYLTKAPQCFYLKDIYQVAAKALNENLAFVDSCSLMSYFGYIVHIIETDYRNIKITTPEDYYIMRALLDWEENDEFRKL